jgi:soluble lytic murein transglycosylase-like protein
MMTSRRMGLLRCALMGWLGLGATSASADCWQAAGSRYSIDPHLLYAMARQESQLNPRAININKNGSEDIGLMQINSQHFPRLKALGIAREHLFDPCTNVLTGAWILAEAIQRYGYSWHAVGAYNAGGKNDPQQIERRARYAWRVYRHYTNTPTAPAP